MQDDRFEAPRALVFALRSAPVVAGRRQFSSALRRDVSLWARGARRAGVSARECARTLGLAESTLDRWLRERPKAPATPTLRPVAITAPSARSASAPTFTVVTARGLRVEGVTLPQIAALEAALA